MDQQGTKPDKDGQGKPVIELQGLHKAFGGQVVLDGIDLRIYAGQTTVILGESGTGKSVLIKHMVGLLRPDRGRVVFDGLPISEMTERQLSQVRRRFGFLFQGGALFDSMTAGENVAFPLRQHTKLSEEDIQRIVAEKLTMVGLTSIENKKPGELSGGQKKRVALARAIALNPEVIFYDEPTTGLDPIRADVINELILKLQRELGVTSVVVTHDMNSAYKVANRMLMLYQGRFIADGTPEQIRRCADVRVQRFIAGQASQEELQLLRTAANREV